MLHQISVLMFFPENNFVARCFGENEPYVTFLNYMNGYHKIFTFFFMHI